jgi:DNA (cytosine-5)-methyltransferase 1
MSKPRLLDLFCGAGGSACGYQRAGFYVVGVDIKNQPRYRGDEFHQGDAMTWPLEGYDAIHASPPCQAHTALRTTHNAKKHESLIEPTRERLIASGLSYVIENVPGAPLINPITLCGTSFGLGVMDAVLRRHRLFESSAPLEGLKCFHNARQDRRTIGVYGGGHGESKRGKEQGQRNYSAFEQRVAMGIDWMTVDELSQAIPPDYTEYIGKQLLASLRATTEGER